jgi:hypothetical protein
MNLIDLKERIALCDAFTPDERDFILDAILAVALPAARRVERHSPPNYLGRIDSIWIVLSVDDGGEGVVAAPFGGMTFPLIAADKQRVEQIRPIAIRIARDLGKVCRLIKFTTREEVEVYQP